MIFRFFRELRREDSPIRLLFGLPLLFSWLFGAWVAETVTGGEPKRPPCRWGSHLDAPRPADVKPVSPERYLDWMASDPNYGFTKEDIRTDKQVNRADPPQVRMYGLRGIQISILQSVSEWGWLNTPHLTEEEAREIVTDWMNGSTPIIDEGPQFLPVIPRHASDVVVENLRTVSRRFKRNGTATPYEFLDYAAHGGAEHIKRYVLKDRGYWRGSLASDLRKAAKQDRLTLRGREMDFERAKEIVYNWAADMPETTIQQKFTMNFRSA